MGLEVWHYLRKDYEKALDYAGIVLKINPNDVKAHASYGILLYEQGRYEEAELHYKEALRINPDLAEAHVNYGVLLKEQGRFKEAELHFIKAWDLRVNLPDRGLRFAHVVEKICLAKIESLSPERREPWRRRLFECT
ncbi:MAG TPA: tetratricopeptide repeat protein [Candidatus Korarchaeota archaeon]|nr:tetratricopeptide repeat protein [Candidatus Korarchaeota archaeon]